MVPCGPTRPSTSRSCRSTSTQASTRSSSVRSGRSAGVHRLLRARGAAALHVAGRHAFARPLPETGSPTATAAEISDACVSAWGGCRGTPVTPELLRVEPDVVGGGPARRAPLRHRRAAAVRERAGKPERARREEPLVTGQSVVVAVAVEQGSAVAEARADVSIVRATRSARPIGHSPCRAASAPQRRTFAARRPGCRRPSTGRYSASRRRPRRAVGGRAQLIGEARSPSRWRARSAAQCRPSTDIILEWVWCCGAPLLPDPGVGLVPDAREQGGRAWRNVSCCSCGRPPCARDAYRWQACSSVP